ncbi:collagenase [Guptibacillus sedimenti]|uniref:collagenase n=1 Tax=Guptibacillus sedimenti TaxID=3025680 RepID=UPI00235E84E2|nr:collagenase [Pseudalkalibacillus sedimenti]
MKKAIKMVVIIFSSIFFLLLLLLIGGVNYIHSEVEETAGEPVTYFQAVKTILNLNYDGELERKTKTSKDMQSYQNVSVYIDKQDNDLVPLIKDTIDWAKTKNKEILGDIKDRDVDIIFFNNEKDFQKISTLDSVSGYYDPFGLYIGIKIDDKKGILNGKETPLYFFQKSILHEFTHYTFDRKVEGTKTPMNQYPLWFQEGVADYIANDRTIVEASDFEFVTYDQLRSYEQWKTARKQDGTDVYDQSYFTIKFLIDKNGENVIEDIIDATSNSGDFKKSFEDVTGLRYDTMLKRLKITLEK